MQLIFFYTSTIFAVSILSIIQAQIICRNETIHVLTKEDCQMFCKDAGSDQCQWIKKDDKSFECIACTSSTFTEDDHRYNLRVAKFRNKRNLRSSNNNLQQIIFKQERKICTPRKENGSQAILKFNGIGSTSFEISTTTDTRTECTFAMIGQTYAVNVSVSSYNCHIHDSDPFSDNYILSNNFINDRLLIFPASTRWFWVSVHYKECWLKFGTGYMNENNKVCLFKCRQDFANITKNKLHNIRNVNLLNCLTSYHKVSTNPVQKDFEPVVKAVVTPAEMDTRSAVNPDELPDRARDLFHVLRNEGWELSAADAAAINFSLDTKGCSLYETLKEKQSKFKDPKMSYIRVTVGEETGHAPGNTYVFEIWPKNHYSPVHDHANAAAIIKVLHGSINSSWYNPLPNMSYEEPKLLKWQVFEKGEYTWLSCEHYQTHKLFNYRNDTMAATIQSYAYLDGDTERKETFDYKLPDDPKLYHFVPISEFRYNDMLVRVRHEYNTNGQACREKPHTKPPYEHSANRNYDHYMYNKSRIKKLYTFNVFKNFSHGGTKKILNRAKCQIYPKNVENSQVNGVIHFEELDSSDSVNVYGTISHLQEGKHALHIHEFGDTSSQQCILLGGHFNPHNRSHGFLNDTERHTGDFGDIVADENGVARFQFPVQDIHFDGPESILGRGMVVHVGPDNKGRGATGRSPGDHKGPAGCCTIALSKPFKIE